MTVGDVYTPVVDSLTPADAVGLYVQKRIGDVTALDAYAAMRRADEYEALIIEVHTQALVGIRKWPSSRGFELRPEPLETGPAGKTRIYLQLSDTRYREVFRALCGNACEAMLAASSEKEAVHLFHQRLVRWQSFLQKHGLEGLSEQEQCGLFGELLILRDLLLPVLDPGTVVQGWRGYKKAPQDFQFLDRALEVKTTRAAIPDRISISSVQQLDSEGMNYMFLTVVHVDANETAGETLPELVASLRSALPDTPRDQLDGGLEEVGYGDAHRELYERTRYLCLELLHFDVREGFPRLTRDLIPDGIKRVRYELSIDACRPFQMDQQDVLQVLGDEPPSGP